MDRLYQVIETLLIKVEEQRHDVEDCLNDTTYAGDVIDTILDCIEIKDNRFTDLVNLVELCDKYADRLTSLAWFKKRLVDKIYEWRGEEGKLLINRIMKVK
jgi:hypothetical protein